MHSRPSPVVVLHIPVSQLICVPGPYTVTNFKRYTVGGLHTNTFLKLLCCVSISLTVDVHPGEDITLSCSNISPSPTQTDWFRVVHGTKPSCISSMYGAEGEPSYCDGFHREKFIMSSNKTVFFLQIKQVDLMDSGLYFCGFYVKKHTVIGRATERNNRPKNIIHIFS
uniref:Ig-like domain-containing protein n=1 Tax=Xiphophorus maculatus TaxID=8083 RepID=M4AB82_XIPMA